MADYDLVMHCCPRAFLTGIAFVLAAAVCAQARGPVEPADPLRAILDEALAAPAEVFADIALDLIERKRLNPRETRPLLEDVFHRAGEAKQPLPLRYAGPESITALTSTVTDAHNLKLDALSIRCRAVRTMLGVDPRRGRQLFEEIPPAEVPKPTCDHEFAPAPTIYVQTLAAVVERGAFTRQEREKQVPWWMIESGARRARNSWEIIGAMNTFPAFVRNEMDAKMLAAALAASLAITDSDRSFTSALRKGELIPTVLTAGSKLRRDGASDVSVLAALRGFLVRHLSGNRCKDSVPGTLDGIDAFNAAVRGRPQLPVLAGEELSPAAVSGEATRQEYGNATEFQERLRDLEQLGRVNRGESLWAVRLTPDWTFRALQALARVQDWKGAPEQEPVELFHQKAALLWRLLDVVPAGRTFDTVLAEMIALFEDGTVLQRSPAEWIAEVRRLQIYQRVFTPDAVQALRSAEPKPEGLPFDSGREISEALSASRLSALSLYGRVALLDGKR